MGNSTAPERNSTIIGYNGAGGGGGINSSMNVPVSMDVLMHKLIEGKLFVVQFGQSVTGLNKETAVGFNTPDDVDIYLDICAEATNTAEFYLYEEPSLNEGVGTEQTILNKNRNSGNTIGISSVEATPVENTVTTYDDGEAAAAGITTTNRIYKKNLEIYSLEKKGNEGETLGDFILKRNSQYVAVITAKTSGAQKHCIRLSFFVVE